MGRPATITMSMRELDRCKVIEAVVQDGLMVWRAAEKLGISKRLGELVQIDGTDHAWFEGRAPVCTLQAFHRPGYSTGGSCMPARTFNLSTPLQPLVAPITWRGLKLAASRVASEPIKAGQVSV